MPKTHQQTVLCQICKKQVQSTEALPGEMVREPIASLIRKTHPDWSSKDHICLPDLNTFRAEYFKIILETEKGELSALEADVVRSMQEQDVLSKNTNLEFDRQLTVGEHIADAFVTFGGSWKFIIFFFCALMMWITINSVALLARPFDPYPYILLNLVLSCLAAMQAPIIMMSQNRQEARDRLRAEHDYRINLKAELEVRNLNAKVDLLISHQWQRLMKIQEIQMEIMEEVLSKK